MVAKCAKAPFLPAGKKIDTLPKTNIAPKNGGFAIGISSSRGPLFSGAKMLVSGRGFHVEESGMAWDMPKPSNTGKCSIHWVVPPPSNSGNEGL